MSETYAVESTLAREEWTGNYGPMITYRLLVSGGQEVDLNQKPETPAPTVGQEILGHLETKDGYPRPKLKKDTGWKGDKGGGDDEGPLIHRQVALKILAPTINEQGGLTDSIRDSCKEIEEFIEEAEQSSSSNGNPPAAFNAAAMMNEIKALLETEIDSSGAEAVLTHVGTAMDVDEQRQALDFLRKELMRTATIKRLIERTEEANGEPIPVDDKDIPF